MCRPTKTNPFYKIKEARFHTPHAKIASILIRKKKQFSRSISRTKIIVTFTIHA